MAKYILKNVLPIMEVKVGDWISIEKRLTNTIQIKPIKITKGNINQLIEDNIIEQVENVPNIDFVEIKKTIKSKCRKQQLTRTKIIRLIAIEIDKYYKDNISEQDGWYYIDDDKVKFFFSNTNFNYYNGNGYGLFRNGFEAYFAKELANNILNGKQESKKC